MRVCAGDSRQSGIIKNLGCILQLQAIDHFKSVDTRNMQRQMRLRWEVRVLRTDYHDPSHQHDTTSDLAEPASPEQHMPNAHLAKRARLCAEPDARLPAPLMRFYGIIATEDRCSKMKAGRCPNRQHKLCTQQALKLLLLQSIANPKPGKCVKGLCNIACWQ